MNKKVCAAFSLINQTEWRKKTRKKVKNKNETNSYLMFVERGVRIHINIIVRTTMYTMVMSVCKCVYGYKLIKHFKLNREYIGIAITLC